MGVWLLYLFPLLDCEIKKQRSVLACIRLYVACSGHTTDELKISSLISSRSLALPRNHVRNDMTIDRAGGATGIAGTRQGQGIASADRYPEVCSSKQAVLLQTPDGKEAILSAYSSARRYAGGRRVTKNNCRCQKQLR